MKLEKPNILQLMPEFMRNDETVKVLAAAFDDLISRINSAPLRTWGQIENLQESELDDLAQELRVLWYDSTGAVGTKIIQLKTSDEIWQHLGTRYAVELAISQIFGEATLLEWHEYDAAPHHFKIQLNKPGVLTAESEAAFRQLVEIVKRKSQILDSIELIINAKCIIYSGLAVLDSAKETVNMKNYPRNDFQAGPLFSGLAILDSTKQKTIFTN